MKNVDDMTDIKLENLATTRSLMIATEADDLLDFSSVDGVMGMAAFVGFDARFVRMPSTLTHATGLNTAGPDNVADFKHCLAQFLNPRARL